MDSKLIDSLRFKMLDVLGRYPSVIRTDDDRYARAIAQQLEQCQQDSLLLLHFHVQEAVLTLLRPKRRPTVCIGQRRT